MIPKHHNRNTNGNRFSPAHVPQVAAGFFWDPTRATGSGASIVVPEGNGKATYNMVTPAANTAPTAGLINGQVVAQYANGVPDQLMRTSAAVTRGWTGATYFAVWLQASAAIGSVFGHWRTANNLLCQINGADCRMFVGAAEQRFSVAPLGATPFFLEAVYDPALAATARAAMFINRIALTQTTSVAIGATIPDTSEVLTAGGVAGDASNFNYSADFRTGVVYLANGLLSAADRDRLYNFRRLT